MRTFTRAAAIAAIAAIAAAAVFGQARERTYNTNGPYVELARDYTFASAAETGGYGYSYVYNAISPEVGSCVYLRTRDRTSGHYVVLGGYFTGDQRAKGYNGDNHGWIRSGYYPGAYVEKENENVNNALRGYWFPHYGAAKVRLWVQADGFNADLYVVQTKQSTCSGTAPALPSSAVCNQVKIMDQALAAGTNLIGSLIAPDVGQALHICYVALTFSAATTLKFLTGGDPAAGPHDCSTNARTLTGPFYGVTALTLDLPTSALLETDPNIWNWTTGDYQSGRVCINSTAAVNVGGVIGYAAY